MCCCDDRACATVFICLGWGGEHRQTHVVHVTRCQCELRITARGPLRGSKSDERLREEHKPPGVHPCCFALALVSRVFFASVWLLWSHGTRQQSTRQDVDDALRLDWEASKGQAKFVFLLGVEMC